MEQESVQIVTLRDFELQPNNVTVCRGGTLIIKVGQNSRGLSQVYSQVRSFIFVIEQLEVETTPLRQGEQYQVRLEKCGNFLLQCLSYSKVSANVRVVEDTSSSSRSNKMSSNRSLSAQSPEQIVEQTKQTAPITFKKYEDFLAAVGDGIQSANQIPDYLLSCFKRELSILQSTNQMEMRQDEFLKEGEVREFRLREDTVEEDQREDEESEEPPEKIDEISQEDKEQQQSIQPQTKETVRFEPDLGPHRTFQQLCERYASRLPPLQYPTIDTGFHKKLLIVLRNRYKFVQLFE